jgi:hypothetical protein
METTDKELIERFEIIPDEIAIVLANASTTVTIDELCKKYTVPFSEVPNVEIAVALILLGEEPVRDFEESLQELLSIPEEDIELLATELFTLLFANIIQELDDLYISIHSESLPTVNGSKISLIERDQSAPQPQTRPKITLNFSGAPVPSMNQPATDGPVPLIPKNRPNIHIAHTTPSTSQPVLPPVPSDHLLREHFAPGPAPMPTEHVDKTATAGEAPQTQPTTPPSIFQAKLQGQTRIPTEESKLETKNRPRDGIDPYREPPTI